MSIHVMSWVFKHSDAKLGARLVLLVLADHAKDDGTMAWPSVKTIAHEARMSPRGVHQALRRLEADGMIEATGQSRKGTSIYSVVMAGSAHSAPLQNGATGVKKAAPGGEAASPEPSKEPSKEPSGSDCAREHPEFGQWMGYHSQITTLKVLRAGTKARAHVASMFAARREEGHTLVDLEAAVDGAWADEFRRRNGYVDPESVLRPTKVGKLIAAGHAARKRKASGGESWLERNAARLEELGGGA